MRVAAGLNLIVHAGRRRLEFDRPCGSPPACPHPSTSVLPVQGRGPGGGAAPRPADREAQAVGQTSSNLRVPMCAGMSDGICAPARLAASRLAGPPLAHWAMPVGYVGGGDAPYGALGCEILSRLAHLCDVSVGGGLSSTLSTHFLNAATGFSGSSVLTDTGNILFVSMP